MDSSGEDAPLSVWRSRQLQKTRGNVSMTSATPRDSDIVNRSPPDDVDSADDEQESWQRQELELQSRRLDFHVAQWKQQQLLRRERLQIKCEEINGKESLTRQQQEMEAMEIRARVVQALTQTNKNPAQVREYMALLEG